MSDIVSNLDEYIKITKRLFDSGCFTFRGQCCSSWLLEPGIIRRIKKTYTGISQSGLLFSLSIDSTIDLLKSARLSKHFKQKECDLNILAILQHYGAATPLLDFTYDPLVALYFACQSFEKNGTESDGKVFSINCKQVRSHNSPMRHVLDPSKINIQSDLLPNKHRGIWYWNPPDNLPCKRNKKQQSVFVFGWDLYWEYYTNSLIKELTIIAISADSKKDILMKLEEEHNISEQTLFPDIHGFAQSNSHDKIIQNFSAEEFYNKGEDCYWEGDFEWAAQYYKMTYTKKPDWIDARCNCALSLNGYGEQSEALKVIEDSIKKLREKWKLLVCKAIINKVMEYDWKADIEKAEEMANNENEGIKFKQYLKKYGWSIFRSRFAL
jgi:hypothetical protein